MLNCSDFDSNGTLPPCPPHHPGPYDGNVVLGMAKLLLMVLGLVAAPIMCCIVVRCYELRSMCRAHHSPLPYEDYALEEDLVNRPVYIVPAVVPRP